MANDTHTWRHNITPLTHTFKNSGLMRTFLYPHNINPLNLNPLTLRGGWKNSIFLWNLFVKSQIELICVLETTSSSSRRQASPSLQRSGDKMLDIKQCVSSNKLGFQEEWKNSSLTAGLSRNTWLEEMADTICLWLLWPPSPLTSEGPLHPAGVQMKGFRRFRNDITLTGKLFPCRVPTQGTPGLWWGDGFH